jgi:hypothetical protein
MFLKNVSTHDILREGVFVTQLSGNAEDLNLTNCVGYDKLMFHERCSPFGINPRNRYSFSVRHKKFDPYPGFSATD